MFIVMLVAGLGGAFFYYVMLLGLATGELKKTRFYWFRCVAIPAFLMSVSLSVLSHYFGATLNLWLSSALWPVVALFLHGGYRVALRITDQTDQRPEGRSNEG